MFGFGLFVALFIWLIYYYTRNFGSYVAVNARGKSSERTNKQMNGKLPVIEP